MKGRIQILTMLLTFLFTFTAFGYVSVTGVDTPDDKGASIDLTLKYEGTHLKDQGAKKVFVWRKTEQESEFKMIKELDISVTHYQDKNEVLNKTPYLYSFEYKTLEGADVYRSDVFGPYQAKPQWFNTKKTANLLFSMLSIFIILIFIKLAKQGRSLYIRPLAGVKAIEDAVGRATEMGKPCIYSPGISVIEDIATLASISIISKVSQIIAEYQSRLIVPNADQIVYSVIDEVVKGAYLKAGRPDAYKGEDVYFLTNRQFAYASAMSGLMAREKPAANFFLGWFMAESLILAESGAMTGAIQIAGTDSISQIPFFIVACDYTLIGEELYAAGAVMGNDAQLLGGLKGQDYVKLIAMAMLAVLFLLKIAGVSGLDKILTGGY